jgi:hypothetical protein
MASPNTVSLDSLKSVVAEAASEFGIPEDSIWRKMRAENSGSPEGAGRLSSVRTDAVSPKNAKGIMQVTQVALDDVINSGLIPQGTKLDGLSPKDQVRIGAAYIKQLRSNYSTDPAVEDAMYNYGPKARFRMDRLPEETQGYLKKTGARMAGTGDESSDIGTKAAAFGAGLLPSSSLLSMLLGGNQKQNADLAAGAQEVSAIQKKSQDQMDVARGVQMGAVDTAGRVAEQKAAIAYEQAALGQQLQKVFNLDPTSATNANAIDLAKYEAAELGREAAKKEYDAAASVDFLSNPLGYLVNQLKLPQLAAKNNAFADAGDAALGDLQKRTSLLTAQKNVLVANTADAMKQAAVDEARNNAVMAKANLSVEEAKNLAQSASLKMQQISLIDKIADNNRAALVSVISLQDREEQNSLRNAAKAEIAGKKASDQADEDRLNGRLQTVSSALGLVEPMTVKRLKTLQNKKDQDVWLNAAMSGQMGEDLQTSLGFYLGNGSKNGIMNGGGASHYATAQKLVEAGGSMQSIAERQAMAANPMGKKPGVRETQTAGFKMYEDAVVSSMRSPTDKSDLSSPAWDKTYNPYVAPFKGFNLAIATRPELEMFKNNSAAKAVGALMAAGVVQGENLTAEQQNTLVNSIKQQVQMRTLTPARAAADIATYFSGAAAWNRSMNGYTMFGLPAQDAYLFTAEGGMFVDKTKLDLMNASQVENFFTKNLVAADRLKVTTDILNMYDAPEFQSK